MKRVRQQQHSLHLFLRALFSAFILTSIIAPTASALETDKENAQTRPNKVLIEIYRIAPGKHKAFLEAIESFDEANERAGLPPRQLYVHSDGANWDFMLIQPASTPPEHKEALNKAWDDLDLPSGAKFFISFRENIAEHSDTFAYGPTSASAFLSSLD
ncbi:hypothetical protein ABFZ85_00700 [Hyphococcus formosus]|uniref:hypothetical protein n=1 Tax=Hyphococcus formosus TaxID=3143534 RepID=UPI00398A984F